jgi:hypothetical protein
LIVVVRSQAKVQADTFGVTNVEVAIGLWWKAGNDGGDSLTTSIATVLVCATRQVMVDDLAQKVGGLSNSAGRRFGGFAILGHAPIVEKSPAYKEKARKLLRARFWEAFEN